MMDKQFRYTVFLLLIFACGINGIVFADDGYERDGDYNELGRRGGWVVPGKSTQQPENPDIAPVDNQLYIDECGSCHFPFQPGLLPARSWEKLVSGLGDHFGENAELAEKERELIRDYLAKNALEKSTYPLPRKISNFLFANDDSLRITKNIYYVYEHRQIPKNMVQDNPKVRSLARCNVCHLKAKDGYYTESEVWIPGFGSWKVKTTH